MQNITAARLLPGFLSPAAGGWCAPSSLFQVLGLLSWLRFVSARASFGVHELDWGEVFCIWLPSLLVDLSQREGASQSLQIVTGEPKPESKGVSLVQAGYAEYEAFSLKHFRMTFPLRMADMVVKKPYMRLKSGCMAIRFECEMKRRRRSK